MLTACMATKMEKVSKKDGVGGGVLCAHCKKAGSTSTMKACGRCRRVWYCSRECQKLHWKGGGHKKACGNLTASATGDGERDGAGVVGKAAAPLQNPCPICLELEDDDDRTAGEFGLCHTCGQSFCGGCKLTLIDREHGAPKCPTCRVALNVPGAEQARRLRKLLRDRPSGRHVPRAQNLLGIQHRDGQGIARDLAEAARWFRLAADQGFPQAQLNLGGCYGTGTGVAQDHAESARWFRRAADQGYARGQVNLAVCYATGNGVEQDRAETARLAQLAAGQGDPSGQKYLGSCYASGTGLAEDKVEAVRWWRLAAEQGHPGAQFELAVQYCSGEGVAADQDEMMRWLCLAAQQGHAEAQALFAEVASRV